MRGVIFDMDGVIVLTAPAHFESWSVVAAKDGITLDYDLFTHTFGRTNPDVIKMIWKNPPTADKAELIADEKERLFREIIDREVPLAPGLMDLLKGLQAEGFVMGVGSSAPPENVAMILDRGAIRPFFRSVADGSEVSRGKPAPDVFLLAAAKASLPPVKCAVIEDAPAGIQAARAAGMFALGVATTHGENALMDAGAHEVFPTLADITPKAIEMYLGPP